MSINYIQQINQALTYLSLTNQLSTLSNTPQNSLDSLLGNNWYSLNDNEPLLSGLNINNSTSLFQNFMQIISAISVFKIFQQLINELTPQKALNLSNDEEKSCEKSAETMNNTENDKTSSLKIQVANANNYKNMIASKGTSWVIFTNPVSCGHCDNVKTALNSVLKKINGEKVSSLLQINLRDNNNNEIEENMDLLYSLVKKFGINGGQYPFAVKFVDGKPVEMKVTLDKGTKKETVKSLLKMFNGN
ncbi:hypothetical protein IJS77_02850 [bacterium]|nr:hypothetical protein [bacterium]